MSDRSLSRDLARRALAIAVRVLPGDRREWGEAMLAELAAIDERRARRRHALGCTRAVLLDRGSLRVVGVYLVALTYGVMAVSLAIASTHAGMRIERTAFVAVLGILAWAGRRHEPLGPVADPPIARHVRGCGYIVVGICVTGFLSRRHHDDIAGELVAAIAVAAYLVAVLVVTARRTAASALTLRRATGIAAGALTTWWIAMLLVPSVRAHPAWALLTVLTAILSGLLMPGLLGWTDRQALVAGITAGVATCMLIFVAVIGTYAAFPRLVPDVAGPTDAGGLTPAARAQTNQAESQDPYVAELLLGALLSATLIAGLATTRNRNRPMRPT